MRWSYRCHLQGLHERRLGRLKSRNKAVLGPPFQPSTYSESSLHRPAFFATYPPEAMRELVHIQGGQCGDLSSKAVRRPSRRNNFSKASLQNSTQTPQSIDVLAWGRVCAECVRPYWLLDHSYNIHRTRYMHATFALCMHCFVAHFVCLVIVHAMPSSRSSLPKAIRLVLSSGRSLQTSTALIPQETERH